MHPVNFIFGLGIFLFGMSQLEFGASKLGQTKLRHWLRSNTSTPFASIVTGTFTTALLQSSSMVSLLVMAFASAGILPLVNAVGIIVGANLGTTLTGWLVALFGFKLDLTSVAMPLFGIAAFTLTLVKKHSRSFYVGSTALGISLLLFGLGIMKTSMESIPQQWDISILQGHMAIVYLLAGVILAALVQSSSAVMIMALASINAEFIALHEAAALVIGADLGTTSTTILGSLSGNIIKRQLALAHFVFNLTVDLTAFFFLLPILPLLLSFVQISDPIYSLVAFHSLINIVGVLAFTPFLQAFSDWVAMVFARHTSQATSMLDRVPTSVVDAALTALRTTVQGMMLQAVCNNLHLFKLKPEQLKILQTDHPELMEMVPGSSFNTGYEELKNQEGEILNYSLRLQAQSLGTEEAAELQRLLAVTRNMVFSNKSLKDIRQDLHELKDSNNDSMRELYTQHKDFQKFCYEKIIDLQVSEHSDEYILEELNDLQQHNERHAETVNRSVHAHAATENGDGASISIQLNTNWEIKQALTTMITAMEHFYAPSTTSIASELTAEPSNTI